MYQTWNDGAVYPWMTWEEIQAAGAAECPIIVPVGSTEQHGRHLPVCTDWVIPTEIVRRANDVRPVVVGPTIPFGYRSRPGSGGGQHFPGTVSLRATTFMALVEDVLSELVRGGFSKIVLYNWHFENVGFVYEAACLVSERLPDATIVVVEDAIPPFTEAECAYFWPDGFPGLALEHAAVIETSLWMHLDPTAVRTDRIAPDAPLRHPPYDILPIDRAMSTASGSLSSPLESSATKGAMIVKRTVDHLIGILDTEFPRTPDVSPALDPVLSGQVT